MTPIKAIRAHCLDCCCNSRAEVKLCPIAACPLHPYRMGHRPKPGEAEPEEAAADFEAEATTDA